MHRLLTVSGEAIRVTASALVWPSGGFGCARTTETEGAAVRTVARVRTRGDWPEKAEFLEWLDLKRTQAGIRSYLELAERAGISHTSISGWRTGRQKPSMSSLESIAKVIGAEPREVWVRAGLMDAGHAGLSDLPEPEIVDDEESIRLIMQSDAPEEVKEEIVREIRRMQRQAADERATWAQRLLEMSRRLRGAT
jgi:transcriptional regulator with XRE-family HTH domain